MLGGRPPRPRRGRSLFAIAAAYLATVSWTPAGPPVGQEYKVKASYLFNFAQFVDWPETVFAHAKAPFRIGVLGDDEFGPFLDQLVQGETVKSRPLSVLRSRAADDLKACHIVFISRSEKARLGEALATLGNASILTVSETGGFAERGGMINLVLEGSKVRFEANPDAARSRGLKLGAQLLSLAKIVRTSPRQEDLRHERAP